VIHRIEVDVASVPGPGGPLAWGPVQRPSLGWEVEAPQEPLLIPRSVWGWLFRRSWIVVIAALVGAVLQIGLVLSRPPLWEAESAVVVTESSIPFSNVGSVARTAFTSEPVIQPVIDALGLNTTARSLLSSDRIEAVAVGGTGALRIIARWPDPDVARDLSRGVAESFAATARDKGLGEFAVFQAAGGSARADPGGGPPGLLGAGAGAAAGLALLLLMFMIRQPVTSEREAGAEIRADATFRARVRSPGRLPMSRSRHGPVVEPAGLGPALSRSVRVSPGAGPPLLVCLLADRRRGAHRAVRLMAYHLTSVDGLTELGEDQVRVVYSDHPSVAGLVLYARTVVVIAPADASRRSWRRIGDELRVAGEEKSRILVFVT
jgi:hypothetical protein